MMTKDEKTKLRTVRQILEEEQMFEYNTVIERALTLLEDVIGKQELKVCEKHVMIYDGECPKCGNLC